MTKEDLKVVIEEINDLVNHKLYPGATTEAIIYAIRALTDDVVSDIKQEHIKKFKTK